MPLLNYLFSFVVIAFGIVRLGEDGLAAIESIGQGLFGRDKMGPIQKIWKTNKQDKSTR